MEIAYTWKLSNVGSAGRQRKRLGMYFLSALSPVRTLDQVGEEGVGRQGHIVHKISGSVKAWDLTTCDVL